MKEDEKQALKKDLIERFRKRISKMTDDELMKFIKEWNDPFFYTYCLKIELKVEESYDLETINNYIKI
jgi:hypothetical protein